MSDDNIINKMFSFISRGDEDDDDKKILLKQISREIQQNKYSKFYHPRQDEADSSLALYFWNIYKIVYPAKSFMHNSSIMNKIKHITLESYLDKPIMDMIKKLTMDSISERRKTAKSDFTVELEKDLDALVARFDSPRLAAADKCYNLIMTFYRFVSYDYFGLLRKFDLDMKDDFTVIPKFLSINADAIASDLAVFISIVPSYNKEDDWKTVFEILKYCNGGNVIISQQSWLGLLDNLRDLLQSKILEKIIRLASGNPIWDSKSAPPVNEHLSSSWLSDKSVQIRQVISDIENNQRNVKIANLEKEVFVLSEISRLHYYTNDKGSLLTHKGVDTYTYASALNHLTAFIQDFVSKEMAELYDILLVRGQWTQNADSIAMSEAYHNILSVLKDISELDESLSEDGVNGPRIRGALLRVDRDHTQIRYLNTIINSVNEEALNIINQIMPDFVTIGKDIKLLSEDCQRKAYEVIMNWKELGYITKIPMPQRLNEDYKKINCFIQLMYLEIKADENEE